MNITCMKANHVEQPLGFQPDPLHLSWVVEGSTGTKQHHARVQVFQGELCLFDSGNDPHADSMDYPLPLSLSPRTRYRWIVEVTSDNGDTAVGESWFETGKQTEPWVGKWISPARNPSHAGIILEKEINLPDITAGRAYLCGLGICECYINGKKLGDEFLAPGYHSYDLHLQVQTYDCGGLFHPGKNTIQLWLADGWFKGRLGFDGGHTDLYGERLCAIGEFYLNCESEEIVIPTDESWVARPSPITFSSIYDGEHYDARLECAGEAGAVEVCPPHNCGPLEDRCGLPIVKKEHFLPDVLHTPGGETVLDFGQNLTGWVEFDCALPAGQSLRLTAGEILQNDCFYRENLRTAKAEYIYTSNGQPAHVRPRSTFYGFRYMKAEWRIAQGPWQSLPSDVNVSQFTAWHLRSDFDQTGFIETGNAKVNQLLSNILWGQKDNFLDVPTDCPQRDERLGWTGDAQIFSETACCNMDVSAFFRKYLWDMRAEQSLIDGAVPNVVPRLKEGMVAEYGACPWADAGVIIPWNVYLYYGSKSLLAETYPGMKAWVDYQQKQVREDSPLLADRFHFADWLALDNPQPGPFGKTDGGYVANAYYYRCTSIVAQAAADLGLPEAQAYRQSAESIKTAILAEYFTPDGLCSSGTQTGEALAILFGLTPDREKAGAQLNRMVAENNGKLNTGFVGTAMLMPALSETGHHDCATDLLLNEEYPGWLYAVNLGATTIWERWNSVLPDGTINSEGMNSLNHYSYGSVGAWVHRYLMGLQPIEPGFRAARIAPMPDSRLGQLTGQMNTPCGTFQVQWTYEQDTMAFTITVPFGATAQLILPDGTAEWLSSGTHQRSCPA